MSWDNLLYWSGYDLVGVLLSVFGGIYAYLANRNAKRATSEAQRAVTNVQMIDAVSDFEKMQHRVKEIRLRITNNDHLGVAENCSDLQSLASRLLISENVEFPEGSQKKLVAVQRNAASIKKMMDKKVYENVHPDMIKVMTLLDKVSVSLIELQTELKDKVNSHER